MSKQLATIQLNVDFPKDDTFYRLKMPDIEKVKLFYHEMRFMSLLRELGEDAEEKKPEAKEEFGEVRYHLIEDELAQARSSHN